MSSFHLATKKLKLPKKFTIWKTVSNTANCGLLFVENQRFMFELEHALCDSRVIALSVTIVK